MDSRGQPAVVNNSSTEITQSIEDDPLVEGPLISPDALDSAIKKEFQRLPTPWAALLLQFLHVVFVSLSFALTIYCSILDFGANGCHSYLHGFESKTVVIFAKVVLWLLFLAFERYVQYQHSKCRKRGYLQFYRSTRSLKRLPLVVHSVGNAAMLVILSALLSPQSGQDTYNYLLLAVLGLEFVVSTACLLVYTVKVINFNKEMPRPDVNQEERQNAYPSRGNFSSIETGFREGSSLEEVVEKQADLIEYLKQHNTLLSKRILSLTSQQIRD